MEKEIVEDPKMLKLCRRGSIPVLVVFSSNLKFSLPTPRKEGFVVFSTPFTAKLSTNGKDSVGPQMALALV